jgi:hypothetical protein
VSPSGGSATNIPKNTQDLEVLDLFRLMSYRQQTSRLSAPHFKVLKIGRISDFHASGTDKLRTWKDAWGSVTAPMRAFSGELLAGCRLA